MMISLFSYVFSNYLYQEQRHKRFKIFKRFGFFLLKFGIF